MSIVAAVREEMIRTELREAIDALQRGLKATARQHFDAAKVLISGRDQLTVDRLERERGLAERGA